MKQKKPKVESQVAAFKAAARALECDESEEAFDKALRKIGKRKPADPPQAKKPTPPR